MTAPFDIEHRDLPATGPWDESSRGELVTAHPADLHADLTVPPRWLPDIHVEGSSTQPHPSPPAGRLMVTSADV